MRGQGEHWRDEAAGHFDRHTLPSGEDQAVIILIPLARKLRSKDMGFQPQSLQEQPRALVCGHICFYWGS